MAFDLVLEDGEAAAQQADGAVGQGARAPAFDLGGPSL
jgi:hypothetical protein